MSERMKWNRWPLLLAAVVMLGCASGPASRVTYHDPNMDFSLAQTVAVMPFANLTPNPNAADRTRDVFMTMLQAGGGLYVLPPGEVARGSARANLANPIAPTSEEVVALAKIVQADIVVTGTVLEYGEVRSGSTSSNIISVSLKMLEAQTGKVVWTASSTQGGVTASARLFGGGGQPMDEVTEKAVEDLLDKLFKKR